MNWPCLDLFDIMDETTERPDRPMITLKVTSDQSQVRGFSHLWCKYVMGFDPTVHCMQCLIGHRSTLITRSMPSAGIWLEMNEARRFDYLYICGVTRNWSSNFHLVLRPRKGVSVSAETHNGITFDAEDAEQIDIPWLPDGYRGLPLAFTTCRNYQFGEAIYGVPSRASDAA